jgi:opacity protein-like surface antigen
VAGKSQPYKALDGMMVVIEAVEFKSALRSWGSGVNRNILKRHLLASVGLMALTAAGSANAANLALPPPPAAAWGWSGVYIGGHGGYGWGRDPFTDPIFGSIAPPLSGVDSHGFVGGFQAGANWQAGAWVGGLEIDFSVTNIKGSTSTSTGILPTGGGNTALDTASQADKLDFLGSARARLGYLPWPNVLIYGTGGPAWTRQVQTLDESLVFARPGSTQSLVFSSTTPNWRFGAVVGVGAEARLWDSNWLMRLEYLHYEFGKSDTFTSTDTADDTTSGRLTADVVRAGLSYKFGQASGIAGSAGVAMPVKAPRAAAWTWSGFYLGGHAGYGWGRDPFTTPNSDLLETITLTGVGSNGFLAGFQAGANWQTGAWVGGLEADLSGTDIKGSSSSTVPITAAGITGTDTVARTDKFELLGSARARLGYLAWPSTLFYGTGGLAWTRLVQTTDETEIITAGGTSFVSSDSDVSWRFGWVAGLGAETRIWDTNWLARIEYLHSDFGNSSTRFGFGSVSTSGHLTTDVVRGGLSYKFDSFAAAAGPAISMPVTASPAVGTAWNWSGFYLGGHAGYGWGRDPMSDAVFGGKTPGTPLRTGINSNGLVAGFQAGANRQIGAWVGGLEIDLSATGIKGSTTNVDIPDGNMETDTDKLGLLGSARARLGYLALPNVLLYGTGGLAWTRLDQSVTVTDIASGTSFGSSTPSWDFGWAAGAGGETRLWDSNWLLRVEYLHYDFGDSGASLSSFTFNAVNIVLSRGTGHLTTDVVRTAVSFKFD